MEVWVSEFRELAAVTRTKGQPTWYEKITPELSEQQKTDLDDALADRSITPGVIAVVLKRWGYEATTDQISRHRRRHEL